MALTVSEVARLAGVSIRTLHHYDETGLVRPSGRSAAGYRLYAAADLERLQQVLFFKELGFALEQIQRIVGDPKFDVRAALRMQRQLLTEKATRIKALIAAVDAAIDSTEQETTMTDEERFEVFGDYDPSRYEDEVKQRWGNTDAYRESAKRTKGYGKEDWARIKDENNHIFQSLAQLLEDGIPADSCEAMALAERHREHVEQCFHPCPHAVHGRMGDLYVGDPRFTASLERFGAGLAEYAYRAWRANADAAID